MSLLMPAETRHSGLGSQRADQRALTVLRMSPIPANSGLSEAERPGSKRSPTLTRNLPRRASSAANPRSTSSDVRVVNPPEPVKVIRP